MPLGIQRINARRAQPNDRITFIKALPGPSEAHATDFLERIAAICNPIMKSHSLSVTSLEEYEPNPEFLGRNFNGGEVIQLVLKSRSGHWLPFQFVQMVMMHELAHCVQMNHSAAFWKVKNLYSDELRGLWAKGYTGEGMWSRGRLLDSGGFVDGGEPVSDYLPEHLCGGTYRSGKRRRKQKPKLSWKEQKERRIAKKFGVNGVKLGEDDDVKLELEGGVKKAGKPRVAKSNRGRELRAAAALARFETTKKEEGEGQIKAEEDIETESGSETESDVDSKEAALDIKGNRIHDGKGRSMFRICDDGDQDDVNVKKEMDELLDLDIKPEPGTDGDVLRNTPAPSPPSKPSDTSKPPTTSKRPPKPSESLGKLTAGATINTVPTAPKGTCPICSVQNDPSASICMVCSHVLDASRVPGTWTCASEACKGSHYVNASDYGVCGVCGSRRPEKV
jgi:hypothetical protein